MVTKAQRYLFSAEDLGTKLGLWARSLVSKWYADFLCRCGPYFQQSDWTAKQGIRQTLSPTYGPC